MGTSIVGKLNGQPVYRVEAPPADAESEFRKSTGADKDPWGDEASERAEQRFDEVMRRQSNPLDCVPNVGSNRVRALDISDPEIGSSSR